MANRRVSTNHALQLQSYAARAATTASPSFTNTAKLPIDVVKRLIASVARRPNLWIRNHNGQKRCDVNLLWHEVSQEVLLPADICRTKWGHLRDNFRKVFIRNTLSDETPTTWRFYSDMRFMEHAVAENIMRQNRFKEQTRYWSEGHPERESNEHNTPQFSFSELSAFFNEPHTNKRIKLEPGSGYDSSLDQQQPYLITKNDEKLMNFTPLMSDEYTQPDPDPDDDDDFDEDAATEENDHHNTENHTKSANGNVFTIEVFDDEEEEKMYNAAVQNENTPALKSITSDVATNTEFHETAQDVDSDRMFLLSLLPYLQKVDSQRKLHIRQKLQSVLIDEFG